MVKVSVIMPTLNVAEYIEECMKSVIEQTLLDIQILVIDAGSTDGTIEIITRMQETDARITILHSEQKSYGYQVNMGIDNSDGKYIAIVEADDCIAREMLEELVKKAEGTGADYVKGNFYDMIEVQGDRTVYLKNNSTMSKYFDKVICPMENLEVYPLDIYLWRGIYNRKFIISNNIFLNESTGAAYQDIGFLYQVFVKAKKAVYVSKAYYMYRRNNSQSSTYNRKAFRYLAEEYDYVQKLERKSDLSLKPYFYKKMYLQFYVRLKLMASSGEFWVDSLPYMRIVQEKLLYAKDMGWLDPGVFGTFHWLECMMILDDIEKYYVYQKYQLNVRKKVIEQEIENAHRFSSIVLVTCSQMNNYLYALLKKKDVHEIVAFCDNSVDKQNTMRLGLKILSFEQATSMYSDALFVIGNNHYSPDIRKQLIDLGIDARNIWVYNYGNDWLMLL